MIKIKYGNKEYENTYDIIMDVDKFFKVDYPEARKEFISNNSDITEEEIYNKSIEMGIDLKRNPEKRNKIIKELYDKINRQANSLVYKMASSWECPKRIAKRWYIVYTSWAFFKPCTYNEYKHDFDIFLGQDGNDLEKVISWKEVEPILTEGSEINGIRYVNFFPWRFADDTVKIYPLDKIAVRLKTNQMTTHYLLQSNPYTLSNIKNSWKIKEEDILEIELIESDIDDEEFVRYDEEEKRKKEEIEKEKEREKFEREQKRIEEDRIRKEEADKKQEEEIKQKIEEEKKLIAENSEFLKSLIDEREMLKEQLAEGRATGRTTRIVNQIVEDYYNKPIYTPITLTDHYYEENGKMKSHIVEQVKRRIPNIDRIYIDDRKKLVTIMRITPTFTERATSRINEINNLLELYKQ